MKSDAVQEVIAQGEKTLGASGRLLIRKSGTEPLIRVMGEAEDPTQLAEVIDTVKHAVKQAS